MAKVRVLFVPGVDADNTNAQSLNVREIALRLDPERFQTSLWYERDPDPRLKNLPAIRLLQLPPKGQTWRILREMLAGYDIIAYMDYSPASYLFLHLPRMMRRRTKAAMHTEAPAAQLGIPPRSLRFLYDGIFPRCDVYTAITDFIARDVFNILKKKASHILPVGIDTKWLCPPAARTNPAPVVLFTGTLIERKGPQHMLDAAARFPNAVFRLIGAGRNGYDEVLRKRIAELGLRNVTLDGSRTQSQMLSVMRECDIFLLPSHLEGLPRVTLEAAATGLPVVVFNDYETPTVVDQVTGFQVGNVDEMMQSLGKLIADRALRERMGAAGRLHAEKFDWDLVARHWENAYLEIAGQQAR